MGDTVTVTGTIQIGFYGGAGIYAASSIASAYVLNDRTIVGGSNGCTVAGAAGTFDVGGLQFTSEIAKRACVPFRVVLNRVAFRTRLTGDAAIALRELRDFIEPVVHVRQPIKRSRGHRETYRSRQIAPLAKSPLHREVQGFP